MIYATHPFAKRSSLNAFDENGNEGCAVCGRPRGVHRPIEPKTAEVDQ